MNEGLKVNQIKNRMGIVLKKKLYIKYNIKYIFAI